MQDIPNENLGLLIAYLLPGLTALWGASHYSEVIATWLGGSVDSSPSVVGFLFITLAAVAAGMTVSTIRWMIVDTPYDLNGVSHPPVQLHSLSAKECRIRSVRRSLVLI